MLAPRPLVTPAVVSDKLNRLVDMMGRTSAANTAAGRWMNGNTFNVPRQSSAVSFRMAVPVGARSEKSFPRLHRRF
jgi:hypothetical protein